MCGSGEPISMRLTPGAHPASSSTEIQLSALPPGKPGPNRRGQECPTWGWPSVPTLLVQSWQAERLPVDLLLLLDASSSMEEKVPGDDRTKGALVSQALTSFVKDPGSAGLGVGLRFFPDSLTSRSTAACQPSTYEKPTVPLAELPGAEAALVQALRSEQQSRARAHLPGCADEDPRGDFALRVPDPPLERPDRLREGERALAGGRRYRPGDPLRCRCQSLRSDARRLVLRRRPGRGSADAGADLSCHVRPAQGGAGRAGKPGVRVQDDRDRVG